MKRKYLQTLLETNVCEHLFKKLYTNTYENNCLRICLETVWTPLQTLVCKLFRKHSCKLLFVKRWKLLHANNCRNVCTKLSEMHLMTTIGKHFYIAPSVTSLWAFIWKHDHCLRTHLENHCLLTQ